MAAAAPSPALSSLDPAAPGQDPARPQAGAPRDGAALPARPASRWKRLTAHRWWPWAVTLASGAFVLFVVSLLVRQARTVDWPAVWASFLAFPVPVLLLGGALALASHLLYSTFDLFGRHYTRHGLSAGRTVGITLIAYPFTLNLGSIIGGVTVRYRLYSQQGVSVAAIGQVIGMSILTNWLGYFFLAGAVFWLWSPQLPENWHVGPQHLRWMGAALTTASLLYVAACALRHGRPVYLRGHRIAMPRWPVGMLQVALSAANWMVMGAALWVLTGQRAPYAAALATVLLGAVAGLISRIPAGLGVLEAVGVAVLSAYLPAPQALASVLAYRTLYFFLPLGLAALAFGGVELLGRRRPQAEPPGAAAETSHQNGLQHNKH
ncbi:lysylphosphatidylglycerol synthase domain-containing protein [Acidovorax sp. SUPP2522]|uniref:lysylphosphatidylglycerol synthase transmembrane domain-containing protein n=1 Tax=unclassified Acidovorax TaxID=2684926 RepID=UPI0023499820|nr:MULTISPECIES: YbhN family protein [unclassified Acidovorax]WCM97049.1 lysylphosphatidylglycerol synthase domain-containing protein [Acidovorax sp. GBBC 1281]GKT15714.1 lysylphosphatidylglycerol synthase domain-containing protein [Acidovorax sp. SUPP2522]